MPYDFEEALRRLSGGGSPAPSQSFRLPIPRPVSMDSYSSTGEPVDLLSDSLERLRANRQPGLVDRVRDYGSEGLNILGTVVGAPKAATDWLMRQSAEKLVNPLFDAALGIERPEGVTVSMPEGYTTGQAARDIAGLRATPDSGYLERVAGRAVEFAGDLLDPTLAATGPLGAAARGGRLATRTLARAGADIAPEAVTALSRAARVGAAAQTGERALQASFGALMGTGAIHEATALYDTLVKQGMTPEAAERALGAGLSAWMASHSLRGARAPGPDPFAEFNRVPARPDAARVTLERPAVAPDVSLDLAAEREFLAPDRQALVNAEQARLAREFVQGGGRPLTDAIMAGLRQPAGEPRLGPALPPLSGPGAELVGLSPAAAAEAGVRPQALDGARSRLAASAPPRPADMGPSPLPEVPRAETAPLAAVTQEESTSGRWAESVPEQRLGERRREAQPTILERRQAERRVAIAREFGLPEEHPAVERAVALEREARTDPLTGLANKRGWEELQATVDKQRDHVVILDGKKFKTINDTYGHDVGDQVLRAIGESLKRHVGEETSRHGGDEFGGILRDLPREEVEARAAAMRDDLRGTTVKVLMPDGRTVDIPGVEVHIGIGHGPEAATQADLALNASAAASRVGGRGDLGRGPSQGERGPEPGTAGSPIPGRPDPGVQPAAAELARPTRKSDAARLTPERLMRLPEDELRQREAFYSRRGDTDALELIRGEQARRQAPKPAEQPQVAAEAPDFDTWAKDAGVSVETSSRPAAVRQWLEQHPEATSDQRARAMGPANRRRVPRDERAAQADPDPAVRDADDALLALEPGLREKGNVQETALHYPTPEAAQRRNYQDVVGRQAHKSKAGLLVDSTLPSLRGTDPKRIAAAISRDGDDPVYQAALEDMRAQAEEARARRESDTAEPEGDADLSFSPAELEQAEARFAVRPGPGQRGIPGVAEDVPQRGVRREKPEQQSMFGGEMFQGTEARGTEGREGDGPLFTQERDARARKEKDSQRAMFASAPPFYSQLARAVEKLPQAMKGTDLLRYLQDPKRAVKADELKWTGLDDWLKARGEQKTTAQDVREFLAQNEVGVTDVLLGDRPSRGMADKEVWAQQEFGKSYAELDAQQREWVNSVVPREGEGHLAPSATVDLARVRRAFPGAEWSEREGKFAAKIGGMDVVLEPDATIRVSEAARPAQAISAKAAGAVPGGAVEGVTYALPKRTLVQIAKGAADNVIDHEALHVAMRLALSDKERAAVLRKYGFDERKQYKDRGAAELEAEERAAEAYSRWKPEQPNGLFQRIAAFFRRVYRSFFPDAETVFGRVRGGEAFARPGEQRPGVGTRFATDPEALAPTTRPSRVALASVRQALMDAGGERDVVPISRARAKSGLSDDAFDEAIRQLVDEGLIHIQAHPSPYLAPRGSTATVRGRKVNPDVLGGLYDTPREQLTRQVRLGRMKPEQMDAALRLESDPDAPQIMYAVGLRDPARVRDVLAEGARFATATGPKPAPDAAMERAAASGKDEPAAPIEGKPSPRAGEPTFPINLERIGVDEDVRQVEARVAQALEERMGKARGYRSWAEARQLALESGLTEQDYIRLQKNGPLTDHQITAGRLLREEAAKNVKAKLDARKAADAPDVSPETALEAEREYLAAVTRLGAITQATVAGGAEAARALAIHRMMSEGLRPGEKFFQKLLRAHPAMKPAVRDRLLRAVTEGNQRELIEAARQAIQPKFWDKFLEYWKAGLVSGPPTLLGNMVSNTVFEGWRTGERGLAGAIDAVVSAVRGTEQERYVSEAAAAMMSMRHAMPEALKLFWNGLQEERIKPGSKYEGHVGAIEGTKGRVIRFPFRILQAGDDAAHHIAAQNELFSVATRMSIREARKGTIKQEQVPTRQAELVNKARRYAEAKTLREAGATLDEAAQNALADREAGMLWAQMDKAAKEATFHDVVDKFTQAAMAARARARPLGIPLGDIVAPFLAAPSRILSQAARRTPLGFIEAAKAWKGVKEGRVSQGEFSEALARPMMGTLLGISMFMAAREGLITGSGPNDERQKKLLQATGWQPYSVKVGDSYYSYKRMEPLATVLGLAADLAEAKDEKTAGTVAEKLQGALVQNLTEKSYITGITSLAEAWQDPKRYGARWVRQVQGSLVPNVLRKAAAAIDPQVRDTTSIAGPIFGGIPGLSQQLPERQQGTGEPLERAGTMAERFLSPFPRSAVKPGTELEEELLALDYAPSAPGSTLLIPGSRARVTLDPKEIRFLSEADQRTTAMLRQAIKSATWRQMNGEQRREYVEQAYNRGRAAARRALYGLPSFQRRAKAALQEARLA